nr:DUF1272 domain-containing protein [Pseudoalteromonas sp. TB64]
MHFLYKLCGTILNNQCPNCVGNFVTRPIRPISALKDHPASTKRILKDRSCTPHT